MKVNKSMKKLLATMDSRVEEMSQEAKDESKKERRKREENRDRIKEMQNELYRSYYRFQNATERGFKKSKNEINGLIADAKEVVAELEESTAEAKEK